MNKQSHDARFIRMALQNVGSTLRAEAMAALDRIEAALATGLPAATEKCTERYGCPCPLHYQLAATETRGTPAPGATTIMTGGDEVMGTPVKNCPKSRGEDWCVLPEGHKGFCQYDY